MSSYLSVMIKENVKLMNMKKDVTDVEMRRIMEKFGKVIVKLRIPILILSFLLLIPSAIGYFNTRVNYDILYYLPSEIETMQGQDILMDDFNFV